MKHLLAVLLCLLLCGCSPTPDTLPPETAPETRPFPVKTGSYDPDHPMEKAYPGEVRAYPLTQRKVQGMKALGSDILLLSGEGCTTLTVLTGENLCEQASRRVDFELQQEDPSLQIHENGISFFDPLKQETILLDRQLQEMRRIAAPQNLSGKPILSFDEETLYYCTTWSVMAWDLSSGIRRTLKELTYSRQMLTALHQKDQILECTIIDGDKTSILLLAADNGAELDTFPDTARLKTGNAGYFLVYPHGFQDLMIFGSNGPASLLMPKAHADQQYYLENDHAAVTAHAAGDSICLSYYELNTGILRSSLILDKLQTPKNIVNTKNHSVYILVYDPAADCDTLYRWDVLRQTPDPTNTEVYTTPHTGAESPDALEQCRDLARSIGQKYGITICIGENACDLQPWDYQFTPESITPILEKELELLDLRLSQYPDGVLQQTISHFTGLTICLVRDITGTVDTASLSSATGIQFFQENHAYVVITTGRHSEQALYHELYHVMDTHILTESTALDQWEALNPGGFSYSKDDALREDFEIYLQGQTRAFIDRYSMGYPKEDRARILENAMLQGNRELFQSEYMQKKLTALCRGIREAYKLKKLPETLPWEQYLITPLAPTA